jgi:hypothetical protein
MANIGRRTICTPELTEQICQILRAGNYVCAACDYVGISERVYYQWAERGQAELDRLGDPKVKPKDSEAPFVHFVQSVTRAKSQAEIQSVARIRKAAEEDWKADAWYLERSHQQRWGRTRVEIEHSGKIGREVFHVRIDGDDYEDEAEED